MAVFFTSYVLFLTWCGFSSGLASARSVGLQWSGKGGEDDVDMTQVATLYDVRCDSPGCEYDLQPYCLDNGVIVMGSCSLKKTFCQNGQRNSLQLARSWDSCFQPSYAIIFRGQPQTAAGESMKSGQTAAQEGREAGQTAAQEGREAGDTHPSVSDVTRDLVNQQLEEELLTDPGRKPEVKVRVGSSAKDTEVKVDGDNGEGDQR